MRRSYRAGSAASKLFLRARHARIVAARSRVQFLTPSFEEFMGVIWMILLHPPVHRFSRDQQREVVEHVYRRLWSRGVPLVQEQDHLVIYRLPPGAS